MTVNIDDVQTVAQAINEDVINEAKNVSENLIINYLKKNFNKVLGKDYDLIKTIQFKTKVQEQDLNLMIADLKKTSGKNVEWNQMSKTLKVR